MAKNGDGGSDAGFLEKFWIQSRVICIGIFSEAQDSDLIQHASFTCIQQPKLESCLPNITFAIVMHSLLLMNLWNTFLQKSSAENFTFHTTEGDACWFGNGQQNVQDFWFIQECCCDLGLWSFNHIKHIQIQFPKLLNRLVCMKTNQSVQCECLSQAQQWFFLRCKSPQ